MGRVSDMAMDQQQEGVDELLCEIDHWKGRAEEARIHVASAIVELEEAGKLLRHSGLPGVASIMEEAAERKRAFLEAKK